jgi:3-hydroxyisobutyrate dehydrogenase-like beta-hydroxyacid dehydrogenase
MSKDNVVVGFVGLGTMGGRMAANVQRAGFKLVVHDLHRQGPAIVFLPALSGRTARVHLQGRPT